MHFERTVLPNGVRVLSYAAPSLYGARLRLTYRAGAALEPAGLEGLAHLAEHMPFKGTAAYDARALARAVERLGGEIDAYTDHHETTYLTVVPSPALPEVFAIMAEMLRRPRLDPEDLEKERGVILEELRTYEDEPHSVAYQAALGGLWRGSPLARPVAGSPETVKRLTREHVRGWLEGQYGADRLIIGAAGAVEHAALVEHAARHFGDLTAAAPGVVPAPEAARDGAWVSLGRREAEQVALCLAMPAPAETDPRAPVADALAMLLGGNDCSRLFARLRDDLGLVYSIDAALEHGPGAGQLVVTSECKPGSVMRVLGEIEAVLEGMMVAPPAADELEDALAALRARWLLPFDNPLSYADWLVGRELWHGRVESPRAVAARLEAVTPQAVRALAGECFAPAVRHLALVGPVARTWRPPGWRVESRPGRPGRSTP